jgi:uncharacterized SAM-binding protein YcdF (DUF218 family)
MSPRAMSVTLRVVGAAAMAVFLVVGFTPLPDGLTRWMSRADLLRPAEAIVVLGGGGVRPDGKLTDVSFRRTFHGIELYRRGLAPLLVLSGGPSNGSSEAQVRGEVALTCGIAPSAIVTASPGHTTRDEGAVIGKLLGERGIRRIVLVADAEGMRRAAAVFAKRGFDVIAAPTADVVGIGGGPGDRLVHARRVAMEAVALLYYRITGDI